MPYFERLFKYAEKNFHAINTFNKLVPSSPFTGQNVRLVEKQVIKHSWTKTILSLRLPTAPYSHE